MQRVLVTGGTGFIGFELVRMLCESGYKPRVLVRRPHRAALFASLDIEPVHGDLLSLPSLERAVAGIDTVVHLGARASFESYQRLVPTIVDGTRALAGAAARAGVEHFVFASSLFVHGDADRPIDAGTPPAPRLGYGAAKLEAEEALERMGAGSGMSVASVRLPHVYGAQAILFQQIRRGYAIFPGAMTNRCGHLHVTDAARILAAVAEQRWTGRSAVADRHSATWVEFFALLEAYYPYFRMLRLPRWLGYWGAALMEPLLSRRSRPTLYTKGTVVGFNLELPVRPELIWEDVGLEPELPTIAEGIPAVFDGFVHYRWRHPMLDRRRS